MKTQKLIYWTTTGLFATLMLLNAYAYFTSEEAKRLCTHFGFPDYFRIELAIAKILGALVLVLPAFNGRPKEWAYAGFVIVVVSGFIAHMCSGDPFVGSCSALIALGILLTSYVNYHKLRAAAVSLV